MSKELTTRERNEIIGLAIDYDSESYNNILNFITGQNLYNNNLCNGNKADCRILAALICVANIDNINVLDQYDDFHLDEDNEDYIWYRWDRIIGSQVTKYDDENLIAWIGSIDIHPNTDSAIEKFGEIKS
jgi:hypothetical protein